MPIKYINKPATGSFFLRPQGYRFPVGVNGNITTPGVAAISVVDYLVVAGGGGGGSRFGGGGGAGGFKTASGFPVSVATPYAVTVGGSGTAGAGTGGAGTSGASDASLGPA